MPLSGPVVAAPVVVGGVTAVIGGRGAGGEAGAGQSQGGEEGEGAQAGGHHVLKMGALADKGNERQARVLRRIVEWEWRDEA